MSTAGSASAVQRVVLLDVYRVLAALAVVFFHLCFRGNLGDKPSDVSYPAIGWLFQHGYQGVDFFFMISGFVITFSAAQGNAWKFLYSRGLRLFPAFAICCSLTYVCILLIDDGRLAISLRDYLLNLTMISGLFNVPAVDGVYWSLVAEIQFYGMVAAVMWLVGSSHLEKFFRIWLLASLTLHFFPLPGLNRLLVVEYAPLFVAGATFYYISVDRVTRWRLATLALTFIGASICCLHKSELLSQAYDHRLSAPATIALEALFYLAFTLVLAGWQPRGSRFWMVAGTATYPLYLLHQNIGYLLLNRLHPILGKYLSLLLILALVTALTLIVSEIVEPKVRRALRTWIDAGLARLPQRKVSLANAFAIRGWNIDRAQN